MQNGRQVTTEINQLCILCLQVMQSAQPIKMLLHCPRGLLQKTSMLSPGRICGSRDMMFVTLFPRSVPLCPAYTRHQVNVAAMVVSSHRCLSTSACQRIPHLHGLYCSSQQARFLHLGQASHQKLKSSDKQVMESKDPGPGAVTVGQKGKKYCKFVNVCEGFIWRILRPSLTV